MAKSTIEFDTYHLYGWTINVPGTYVDDCLYTIFTLLLDHTDILPVYGNDYIFIRNKYGMTWQDRNIEI